ncbi:MAG TPA: allantoinase AllB [Solirubrobacteraceae bacterium]|nr:allantoinase AllB [Solirubrobacteraceae bacterium]
MDYDLIVRTEALDIGIADGLIGATAPGGTLAGSATEECDAGELTALPGGVDVHVHCNEPGRTEWEGFATASAALAAGGFTAFFDMPLNAMPATTDVAAFDRKLAHATEASRLDFALWGGLVPGNLPELEPLHRRGVVGFKAFMCETGIQDFRPVDDATLRDGMREIAALGSILAVHAENDAITGSLTAAARARGRTDARAYLQSRPPIVELEAIGRAIALAADTGCRLHIVHVSTANGVELVQAARHRGVDVSWETTPHHLAFTGEDVERIGVLAKCTPVMHDAANRDRLWAHVAGDPDAIVASDHSPAPASLKPEGDFFAAWGGISGAQSTRGVLLQGVADGRLALDAALAVTGANPARRFGLGSKGVIAPGRDADLALVDLDARWALGTAELRYRHAHSPFVGTPLRGAVRHLLARGRWLIRDGEPRPGHHGRLLVPGPPAAGA